MAYLSNKEFINLINQHKQGMYRLALSMLYQQADAEDAVSEAVLKAYENRSSLRKPERFKSWIMQITANEARRIYNKNKRVDYVEHMEDLSVFHEDQHHELWDAVISLEKEHREVVILYYYEQLKLKEIAKVLHVAEGTVKSRLFRAKKQLKEIVIEAS